MIQDPRTKNTLFKANNAVEFLQSYNEQLNKCVASIDPALFEAAFELFRNASVEGKAIFLAGNGGSSSIAEHWVCDWVKGTASAGHRPVRAYCLSSNTALGSAISNDFGYDELFSKQLSIFASPGDLVVFISSSGNSPNILKAAKTARELKLKTLGLTGFSGGELVRLVDVPIHISFSNYGIVEDSHQIIMHSFGQYLAYLRDNQKV